MDFGRALYISTLVFLFAVHKSSALFCTQCNMRYHGMENLCDAPRNMSNCIGCLKTVTKVKLRDSGYIDGWERMSSVVSRYCITPGNLNVRPEGCYKQQNNGGYTERCFCYSDNCNSPAARPGLTVVILVSGVTCALWFWRRLSSL